EHVEIGEDSGEKLAVIVAVLIGDELAVEADLAGFGRIKPEDELGEGGLAAAIAADEKDEFAGPESEAERAKDEWPVVLFMVIGMADVIEVERVEAGIIGFGVGGTNLGEASAERDAEGLDFLQGDVGAA